MKRTIPDQAADARLERLLDEELHAVLDAPAVDLRDTVLRAIDEERGTRILQPRWALAVAAAAILVFAVVTTRHGGVGTPEPSAANRPPLASAPLLSAAVIQPRAERPAGDRPVATAAIQHRSPAPFGWDMRPVDADAMSNEPYLPGAPAGELGDPLRPLPSPPPIAFAPITPAPSVSEFARPVTDFPADNPAPAPPSSGDAGQSGGTRR